MLVRPITRVCRRYASDHAYQKTLLLPQTKFSNRSNLQKTVNELIPQSCDEVYKLQLQEFFSKVKTLGETEKLKFVEENLFVLQDGPPYANGDLHLGHALNKILKDIINRFQLSQGKYVYYKPGWDCHGLPIELKALKQFSEDQLANVSPTKVRSLASSHARKAIKSQKKQFQRFAIMTDWNHPYITMEPEYEINQLRVFLKMVSRGLIKRQNKPVYWGTETKTALAEGELEYRDDHTSLAIYVKFPLAIGSRLDFLKNQGLPDAPIHCLIWTTTPWTLFSNRAICFNQNFEYLLLQCEDGYMMVESGLKEKLPFSENCKVVARFPGSDLKNLQYTNPLLSDAIERPLIHGEHVTNSAGTGLVHTAPGHGFDDYIVGLQNGLEISSPVDHLGRYELEELPQHLHELLIDPDTRLPRKVLEPATTKAILNRLQDLNMAYHFHKYTHSYPYDWRSKKPVIIRATPQWFADLHDVKGDAIDSLKNVKFYPDRGNARLNSFIKNRNEWCISRQRSWGVPIPAFYRKDNPNIALMTEETVEHVIEVIRRKGINSWFTLDDTDMEEWLPENFKEEAHSYYRGRDTMDVWFDSGTAWNELNDFYLKDLGLKQTPKFLADVYLEGSDQHRGWFQSSVLTKVAFSGTPQSPFKTLITHGFTLDENGLKMSKSVGNVISPESVIQGDTKLGLPALGVDGLRYLVAQSNFTTDIVAGPLVMDHVAEALKKFRLLFRFLLGNLQKGTFQKLPVSELRPIDKYTLAKLQELTETAQNLYRENSFSKVLIAVQYHMSNELSAFYFDITKDSLYSDAIYSLKRQQSQTTLFYIFLSYCAIMAPILPTLVQEAWNYLPIQWLGEKDYHRLSVVRTWPHYNIEQAIKNTFAKNELRLLQEFHRQFKELAAEITKPEQTLTIIRTSNPSLPFSADELADILKTASVEISTEDVFEESGNEVELDGGAKITMLVEPSTLKKCSRCWKYNAPVDDALCARCDEMINSNV